MNFLLIVSSILIINPSWTKATIDREEITAVKFLDDLEPQIKELCHDRALKEWIFASNLTDFNRANAGTATLAYSAFWKKIHNKTQQFRWRDFQNPNTKRQFKLLSTLGVSVLPQDDLKKYNTLKQKLESNYARAKICDFEQIHKCDLSLEPEITEIFATSRSEPELKSAWIQWRNKTGNKMKSDYFQMYKLFKKAALLNGFDSISSYELRSYENSDFKEEIEMLWQQLKPFYEELHAYVRYKLRSFYGAHLVTDLIPAHLLGSPWAQTWENIEELVLPYKTVYNANITQKMLQKNLTAYDMARMGVDFFTSLGFPELPQNFWNNSILEKPTDRDIICHASAWDLCDGTFRIKQCTSINEQDLLTLHHELGHTYYQLSYKDLPKIYRDGANPGFHEAIGDLIALSVQTPNHMRKIGLIDDFDELDKNYEINFLLKMALTKIAFLPFGYGLDLWRWRELDEDSANCEWWKGRMETQGVGNPAGLDNLKNAFDPGAKFHVISNVNYIRYFVSMILQFQLHGSLCDISGNQLELHQCDIYGSKEAGQKLKSLLELGSSVSWPLALEKLTNSRQMDARPILNYFKPLINWLKEQNKLNGEIPGWKIPPDFTCNSVNNLNSNYLTTFVIMISNFFSKIFWNLFVNF